jgi:UDP-N-acetyl-D-mannosaminuronic acid dehydrogenase
MGLTYKADVDDMRESPALRIADMVKEHAGINMLACEPHIHVHKAARLYPDAMVTVSQGIEQADIVVFLVGHTRFKVIDTKSLVGKQVLDFCGLLPARKEEKIEERYQPAHMHSVFTQELV